MLTTTCEIKIADHPVVVDALRLAAERVRELEAERDEWERMYKSLLSDIGGCGPG